MIKIVITYSKQDSVTTMLRAQRLVVFDWTRLIKLDQSVNGFWKGSIFIDLVHLKTEQMWHIYGRL